MHLNTSKTAKSIHQIDFVLFDRYIFIEMYVRPKSCEKCRFVCRDFGQYEPFKTIYSTTTKWKPSKSRPIRWCEGLVSNFEEKFICMSTFSFWLNKYSFYQWHTEYDLLVLLNHTKQTDHIAIVEAEMRLRFSDPRFSECCGYTFFGRAVELEQHYNVDSLIRSLGIGTIWWNSKVSIKSTNSVIGHVWRAACVEHCICAYTIILAMKAYESSKCIAHRTLIATANWIFMSKRFSNWKVVACNTSVE